MKFEYYINLDERGEFNSDVRDEDGNTIWEVSDIEEANSLYEDGFIFDFHNTTQIENHLKEQGFIDSDDYLIAGNF